MAIAADPAQPNCLILDWFCIAFDSRSITKQPAHPTKRAGLQRGLWCECEGLSEDPLIAMRLTGAQRDWHWRAMGQGLETVCDALNNMQPCGCTSLREKKIVFKAKFVNRSDLGREGGPVNHSNH